jgi:uncharacterized protein HemY
MLEFRYPLSPVRDVAFEAARLFQSIRRFDRARELLQLSWTESGESAPTAYNLGLCNAALEHWEEASHWFQAANKLSPSDKASEMIARCEAKLHALSKPQSSSVRIRGAVLHLDVPQ